MIVNCVSAMPNTVWSGPSRLADASAPTIVIQSVQVRSIVNRLIDCYSAIIEGMINKLELENKIYENPTAPMLKVKIVKEHFNDPTLNEYLEFYIFLRQLYLAEYRASGEFRKNVTMTSTMNGKEIEIKIDTVTEYYMKTKEFLHFIQRFIEEKEKNE